MPDVKIDLIRPSPYQPRLHFELKTLKESIEKDGMLAVPIVREKPDKMTKYEMIDGERRWRTVKELGWKTIPIEIIDADDEKARRMVYTLNEERQPYTPEENTKFFRRMYDQMGSAITVAEAFRKSQQTVWRYINVSILPKHLQNAVWAGKITIGDIREMEPVFTEAREEIGDLTSTWKYNESPSYQKIVAWCERIYTKEIQTTKELREEYVDPYLARLDKVRIEKAKEVIQKKAPDELIKAKVKLETAEDYERAAKTLKRKAKELLTPEQKAREKMKKQITAAKKSLNTAVKKIDGAEEIINVGGFRKRLDGIEKTLGENPAEAKNQLVALGKEVTAAKKQRQAEIKDEAKRKREEEAKEKARKREEALKKRVGKETMEKLLVDEEFLEKAAEKKRKEELKKAKARAKAEVEPWTEKMASDIADKIKDALISIAKEADVKKTAEKGRLMRNYLFQGSIVQSLQNGEIFDPQDPEDTMLEWSRSHRNLPETREALKKKLGIK